MLANDIFTAEEQKYLTLLHKEFQSHIQRLQSDTLVEKEFERIMIEFSWKSSRIEGNTYSLFDTEALIKDNKRADRVANEVEYKKASILFYEQNNISYFKRIFIEQFEFAVKKHFI